MTAGFALVLLGVLVLAWRPWVRRSDGPHVSGVSEQWRRDHLYDDGKH